MMLASLLFLLTPAFLHNGKCSVCEKWGVKSTVEMQMFGTATAMFCGNGHYDEGGTFVPPKNCNTLTRYGRCSRGHAIIEISGGER